MIHYKSNRSSSTSSILFLMQFKKAIIIWFAVNPSTVETINLFVLGAVCIYALFVCCAHDYQLRIEHFNTPEMTEKRCKFD